MKMKIMMTAAIAVLLSAGPARAEDKPKSSAMMFFRHLKETLSQSAVSGERKKRSGASVAAVRGKEQYGSAADPNETKLKGDARAKKDKVTKAEDAEFEKAVDLIIAGKADEGVKALEEFKTKHPKSRVQDVQQALDQVKAMGAAGKN